MVLISKQTPILYKGHVIRPSWSPLGGYDYFLEGNEEDLKRVDSIEEAKDEITQHLICSMSVYKVETKGKLPRQINITKFAWLEDAVKFATMFNGVLKTEFESI